MKTFEIWPSEAIIFGRYMEDWVEAKRDCPAVRFVPFFAGHVGQFVPDMDVYSSSQIQLDDIPEDIEWTDGADEKHGVSRSTPGVEFVARGNDLIAMRVDRHPR